MSSAINTDASFHAQSQFQDRIANDITLIESCWWDGIEVHAPKRDYDIARLYDGPLVQTPFVMFAALSDIDTCDHIIRTVIPAERIDYEVVGEVDG